MEKQTTAVTFCGACSVRGGGALFSDFQYAYAADVSGGDVTVDAGHPAPSPIAAGNAHDIPSATDNRNVSGNKLTINMNSAPGGSYFGGYTRGAGDSTHNELVYKASPASAPDSYVYGGYSAQGNAINNTVTISDMPNLVYSVQYLHLIGGASGNAGADVRTGNTLRIASANNAARDVANFEKMEFVLRSNISPGDTMFSVSPYGGGIAGCRFVNHMLHKREKERAPHEEISTREGA